MVGTIAAALIGAVLGSIGAQLVEAWLARRAQREADVQRIGQKYLFQLQDATESLSLRLDNVLHRHALNVMSDSYYKTSTLYAFACLLAHKRRLMLDGVYVLLEDTEDGLGRALEDELEAFEKFMGRETTSARGYQRYDRLALAESVLERTPDGWGVTSYIDFAGRYIEDERLRHALAPADQFVADLGKIEWTPGIAILESVGLLLARHTRIPWRVSHPLDAASGDPSAGPSRTDPSTDAGFG